MEPAILMETAFVMGPAFTVGSAGGPGLTAVRTATHERLGSAVTAGRRRALLGPVKLFVYGAGSLGLEVGVDPLGVGEG